jgi:hypothetical protein
LGMFTSFFSHIFNALQPSIRCTEASNWPGGHKSRSHHLFGEWLWQHHSEAGWWTIHIYWKSGPHICTHTDIYIILYIYYIPYSKQRKFRNLEIWCITYTCPHHPGNTFASCSILRPFAKLLEKAMERWYVQWRQWQCASTFVTFDIIWCVFGSFGSLCLIHVRGLVLNPCEVFLQLFRGGFAKPPKRPGVSQASLLGEVRAGIGAIVARRGQQMTVWTVWVKQN